MPADKCPPSHSTCAPSFGHPKRLKRTPTGTSLPGTWHASERKGERYCPRDNAIAHFLPRNARRVGLRAMNTSMFAFSQLHNKHVAHQQCTPVSKTSDARGSTEATCHKFSEVRRQRAVGSFVRSLLKTGLPILTSGKGAHVPERRHCLASSVWRVQLPPSPPDSDFQSKQIMAAWRRQMILSKGREREDCPVSPPRVP